MKVWHVLPDSERQQWLLDPFVSVGPLRFGMSPDEASAVLGGGLPGLEWRGGERRTHSEAGLDLYFTAERLCGISVDARRGPQVLTDGVALVGRVPSELEQWLVERAESREPYTELFYLPAAEAGSLTLGFVLCVQRAGDHLITRPVFLPAEAMDDVYHQLPDTAWAI
ncbi:hypothetical protein [Kitasatospora sp. NPDC059571]|uniref:hypothetical protein n=1 Tax=Kitasatospora sp. NPDC059571 TaxID=3346871 RepID=UPI00369F172E